MKRSAVFVLCAVVFGCVIAACGGAGDDAAAVSTDKLTIVGAGG